LNSYQERWRE